MKKKFFISFILIALILGTIRIYILNSKEYYPIILEYNKNQEVKLEKDFFDSANENMNGYSISVINSDIITLNDFISKYNIQDEESLKPFNYVCLVKVNVKNNNNTAGEEAGINFQNFIIQSGAYITHPNPKAFSYVNDIDYMKFSLRYDSDKDFILPFLIYNRHVNINTFKKMSPQLVVSLFPHKKVIKIT